MRKVIIDTDPGIDDAIALALALNSNLDIKLLTSVAGNVGIDNTTRNANDLLNFYGRGDIPVARGASCPLIIKYEDASLYHGKNGLGNIEIEESKSKILDNAVEAMKNVITESKEKITIITLGPLTNVALLIKSYPHLKDNIEEIIMMGGAIGRGNKEVLVEYNMGADPHAAKIVFDSKIKLVMLGLEMGDNARIAGEDLKNTKTKLGQFCYKLYTAYNGAKENGFASVYDATAIAYADKKELFETKDLFVDIEIEGKYTKGATIVDLNNLYNKKANVKVATKINSEEFRKWFLSKLN